MLLTLLIPPPKNKCQLCMNSFGAGSVCDTATNCITSFLNWVFNGQSFQFVLVYNFTTMHAMCQSSSFCLGRRSTVNIYDPKFCFTITYVLTVANVELRSFQISAAMSDSKYLSTLLVVVMISSKTECVLIRDLSGVTLQIIFDT